jgi:hypothetical protein
LFVECEKFLMILGVSLWSRSGGPFISTFFATERIDIFIAIAGHDWPIFIKRFFALRAHRAIRGCSLLPIAGKESPQKRLP